MKALFALLVVLGLSSCVFAGGYGGGAGYQTYAAYRPAVYQQVGYAQTYQQPIYARPYTGKAVVINISGGGSEIIIFGLIISKSSLIYVKSIYFIKLIAYLCYGYLSNDQCRLSQM